MLNQKPANLVARSRKKPPKDQCNQFDHLVPMQLVLNLNRFEKDEDGGGTSECDGKYHSDDTPIVALSTGWFNNLN